MRTQRNALIGALAWWFARRCLKRRAALAVPGTHGKLAAAAGSGPCSGARARRRGRRGFLFWRKQSGQDDLADRTLAGSAPSAEPSSAPTTDRRATRRHHPRPRDTTRPRSAGPRRARAVRAREAGRGPSSASSGSSASSSSRRTRGRSGPSRRRSRRSSGRCPRRTATRTAAATASARRSPSGTASASRRSSSPPAPTP